MNGSTLSLTMRPREFADVIGLESQVETLRTKLTTGAVPRAFLLKGMFGCGKTTLAYIIAKEIQGWEFTGTPVIQEINAANITGVDAMRELVQSSNSYPMAGKFNVIILDEAHKLSKPAQELLLKPFESQGPTVWIVCTTEAEKLNEGLRTRCFTLVVDGMDEKNRKVLVERAAKELKHVGDITEFLAAVTKAKMVSPRKILQAFETFHAGTPAGEAVGAMQFEALPEHHEIAMGALYGQWDKAFSLFGSKQMPGVCEQIYNLDERLKKRAKAEGGEVPESDETVVDADDLEGRPAVAQALRAITCSMLKNQISRQQGKFKTANAIKAANCLQIMANCLPANSFGLEFPLVVGALYRVNQIMMQGGK